MKTRNILSDYLGKIARIRATRAGTGEISYYGALTGAFNACGEKLKPRVFCVPNLRNRGAGFPDMGDAYWRNIPDAVWDFTIGGYQVLKKWLSYREKPLLGRVLTATEIRYVRDVARRLAALRLMGPALDANYRACAAAHMPLAEAEP